LKNKILFLGAFVKLEKSDCSFVMPACLPACLPASLPACLPACLPVCLSACPHGSTRLPLDGLFLQNLIFECFSKMSRESSSFIKI
jgi:hypothetical protein